MRQLLLLLSLFLFLGQPSRAQNANLGPSILIVTAHPDDDALFAGSVYRLTHELGGTADLALITDGAGGYRYSTLAESIYGLELTDPEVAKQYLPAIRKQELMNGGRIVGMRNYYFLDQPDGGYTLDATSVMDTLWDRSYVLNRLTSIMTNGDYDFILTALPRKDTHGHHKAASLLAVEAAAGLVNNRPVVLGGWIKIADDSTRLQYEPLDGYDFSTTTSKTSMFEFDRLQPIGHEGRLNYKIPASWLIAEHKSQGTMQLFINRGDVEIYWLYAANPGDAEARARSFFEKLVVAK